jgi:hypothetical protein
MKPPWLLRAKVLHTWTSKNPITAALFEFEAVKLKVAQKLLQGLDSSGSQ